jgi:hypothetical protein
MSERARVAATPRKAPAEIERVDSGPAWLLVLGNRRAAALLARRNGPPPPGGGGPPAERTFTDPTSGGSVRRVTVTGLTGGHTDTAIALIPGGLPADGSAVQVLLYLHGHLVRGAHGYDTGKKKEGDDVAFHAIPQQMAASGRTMVGILPQGGGTSEFNPATKKRGKGFNADEYIAGVFARLTEMKAWGVSTPPVPGGVVLSGHSGADVAISEMLSSDLGPEHLEGLFLFDTMWPGAGHDVKIWNAVRIRLEKDLDALRSLWHAAGDRDKAEAKMVEWVHHHGFRLYDVFGAGGTYDRASNSLRDKKDRWLAQKDVQWVLGTPGTAVYDAVALNLVVAPGGGDHDHKVKAENHLKTAIGMLSRTPAPVSRQPVPTTTAPKKDPTTTAPKKTDAELVSEATSRVAEAIRAAAAPFVGTKDAGDIPGMVTMQIIDGKADPRKKLKKTNPMMSLYDALWDPTVVADLKVIDAKSPGSKKKGRAVEARRKLFATILGSLITSAEPGADVKAPDTPLDEADEIATETKLVSKNLIDLIVSGSSWEDVRIPVIVQFGGLVAGTRKAIERANAYYDSLVPPGALGINANTKVHSKLAAALKRAETNLAPRLAKLTDAERTAVASAARSGWSTTVRPNQNAKHRLSDHSFGFAIDFQAALNPNVGDSGALGPVQAVTGKDPTAITTSGKTAAQAESAASDIRDISRAYEAAMQSDATLAPVLAGIANTARAAEKLPALAATAGTSLVEAVVKPKESDRKSAVQALVFPEGVAPPTPPKGPPAPAPGPVPVAPPKPSKGIVHAQETILAVGNAYRASFTDNKRTKRVAASTEATLGSVAAHGFMSLPPTLVGALAGSDAGGLRWLGTSGVHDYMHFELVTRPELFTEGGEGDVAPDDAHGRPA